MPDDVVVDLPGAENEPAHALVVGLRVVDDGQEGAVGELLERRGSLLEPEQALRGHHDERPGARVERLPAQQVEILRGGRAVGDPDVLLGGELQEPLEARARVLRAVALVAVRQQQREPRGLTPFREAGDEELVEDDLRAVDEVAELRLPEHERLGRRDRVAVLEPERARIPRAASCRPRTMRRPRRGSASA